MRKKALVAWLALIVSSTAVAGEWCQLDVPCPLDSAILLPPPYVGNYTCELSAGDMEDLKVEITLLTRNTIAEPSPLVLSKGPNSGGANFGEIKITKNPLGKDDASLKNALVISAPKEPIGCDDSKPNTCDVPQTVMCKQVGS